MPRPACLPFLKFLPGLLVGVIVGDLLYVNLAFGTKSGYYCSKAASHGGMWEGQSMACAGGKETLLLTHFQNEFHFEGRNAMISQDFMELTVSYPKDKCSHSSVKWVFHMECTNILPVDLSLVYELHTCCILLWTHHTCSVQVWML